MEIRLQLLLSVIATGVLLAISGFLLSEQIAQVGESFDEVQNQATPIIISLGNLKADFNHLVAAVLAFSIHASEEHRQDVELARERLLFSYEVYAALENNPATAEMIGNEISTLLLIGDDMMIAAEAAAGAGHMHAEEHHTTEGEHASGDEHGGHAAATDDHITPSRRSSSGSLMYPQQESTAAGHTHAGSTTAGGMTDTAGTGGEFSEEVIMLHDILLEFDQQSAHVNMEIDAIIEDNFANMQTKQNAVLADIGAGANLNILLTIAILGVTGGVGGLVAFSISRRVVQLKKTAGDIARGSLNRQIVTAGSDEIADLAASFEHMRKSLVQAQEDLRDRNNQLNELNIALERANYELKKLDKLKDEFISIASHELRSPIHPILGYASMARDGMIKNKEAIDVIYKQAVRLRQLASDILDVSRIESGTLPYSMKTVNVNEILENCIEAMRPSVNTAVSIVANLDSREVGMKGDAERLTQVFTNLLNNSLKFTKKGTISITTKSPAESNSLVITISDTGGGIPEDILPRLFSKFATKKVGDGEAHGTGLGLFISRSIVEAHGGKISAYNNEKGGATFRIELPVDVDWGGAAEELSIAVKADRLQES